MIDAVSNPMLEDDDELTETVTNPMLEEDDEPRTTPPSGRFVGLRLPNRPVPVAVPESTNPAPTLAPESRPGATAQRVPADTRKRLNGPVVKAENLGKEGYDSLGRRIVRRARREHVTEKDARKLAFVAMSGVTTAEAVSLIQFAKATGFQSEERQLPAVGTVTNRFWKLARMGHLNAWMVNRNIVWTITEAGIAAAQEHGYLLDELATPKDLSGYKERSVQHMLSVSMAMAKFVSPAGLMRETLQIEPVPLEAILTEPFIKRAQARLEAEVFARKQAGEDITYGAERKRLLREARTAIKEGRLTWAMFMEAYPELWTLGQPAGSKALPQHDADFIVALEQGRSTAESRSILVEVELSKKPWDDYVALLHTFQREVIDPAVIERVVYQTNIPSLEDTLRAVDAKEGLGLFDSGRLVVSQLTDRWGNRLKYKQKTIGKPKN
jgi:hypothetical protein